MDWSRSGIGRQMSRSTAFQALLGLRPGAPRSDGPATSMIVNCSARCKRNATSTNRSCVGFDGPDPQWSTAICCRTRGEQRRVYCSLDDPAAA